MSKDDHEMTDTEIEDFIRRVSAEPRLCRREEMYARLSKEELLRAEKKLTEYRKLTLAGVHRCC